MRYQDDDDNGSRDSGDADRKRRSRLQQRIITIPACENRQRREELEQNDVAWLMHYFGTECGLGDPFWYEFTQQQREMIQAFHEAIVSGGDQAIAASRGEGKTTVLERMIIKYVLAGVLSYPVLFAANSLMATGSLDAIKTAFESNVLLLADYPEVCVPVLALENIPNRAHYQVAQGHRHDNGEPFTATSTKFRWSGREIILPNVPGSPSAQAIISTRGLDAAVRGLKRKGRRPDLAAIDDPDTERTAANEEQGEKLERNIERAIGGLGGQQKTIARLMVTTLQNRICVSYRFTDPKQKPSWRGRRFRFLVKKPTRLDLWEQYVTMRHSDFETGANTAHEMFLANRAEMEAGSEVANPNRYDKDSEVCALQAYYNLVATRGPEVVATEYDNDPPEETGPVEADITPYRVQRQLSGYARREVPAECTVLTQGIDVRKTALHWVVRAWLPDGTGYTIDYGVHEVRGVTYGSDTGVDAAVKRAIEERLEAADQAEYIKPDGELQSIDLTLVDAGWKTDSVYAVCHRAGPTVMPVKGFGKSAGCTQANFTNITRRTRDKKPGDGWFMSRTNKLWLVCADADRWKSWEHDRWMTNPERPGALLNFGERGQGEFLSPDEKVHHSYARHICNETEVEEPNKDGTMRRRWRAKSDNTHWLDASYYSDVAANIKGIRLAIAASAAEPKPGEPLPPPPDTNPPQGATAAAPTRRAPKPGGSPGQNGWFSQQVKR